MDRGLWWETLMKVDHLKDPGVDGRLIGVDGRILKWIRGAWTGSIWLTIGTDGGIL